MTPRISDYVQAELAAKALGGSYRGTSCFRQSWLRGLRRVLRLKVLALDKANTAELIWQCNANSKTARNHHHRTLPKTR